MSRGRKFRFLPPGAVVLGLLVGCSGGCRFSTTPGKMTLNFVEYNRGYSFPTHSDVVITAGGETARFYDVNLEGSSFFPDNSIIPNAFIKPLFRLDIKGTIGAFTEPYYGIRFYHFFKNHPNWGVGLDFIHFKVFMADRSQKVRATGSWAGAPLDGQAVIGDYFEELNISHGVNHVSFMLTHRWMFRPTAEIPDGRLQLFVSAGAGPAVPHPQIKTKENGQVRKKAGSYQWRLGNWGMGLGMGLRWKLSPHFGLYGEYKWTYSVLDEMRYDEGEDGSVRFRFFDQHLLWGLSVIF